MTITYGFILFLQLFIPAKTYAITGTSTALVLATKPALISTITPESYVATESAIYGVNPAFSACIVSHESQWQNRAGDDGNSRGYFQISRIYHPEVSDSCAYNLQCSTNWSLAWIAAGHAKQWSTDLEYCSSTLVTL